MTTEEKAIQQHEQKLKSWLEQKGFVYLQSQKIYSLANNKIVIDIEFSDHLCEIINDEPQVFNDNLHQITFRLFGQSNTKVECNDLNLQPLVRFLMNYKSN